MGKNQNSAVVLQIWVKFWWMIPMGVSDNHTKFEEETQRWRPGTVVASGGPQFQKLQFRAKNTHFWPKQPWNTFKTAKRRERVGTLYVRLDFPVPTSSLRPSNSTICPTNSPKRPQKPQILCRLAGNSHKPRTGHIFGYTAQNAIPRAPNPPAIHPHFLWFPPLRIA